MFHRRKTDPRQPLSDRPDDLQYHYLRCAVDYREEWYAGLDEAVEEYGVQDGPIKWAETNQAKALSASNKWHFLQSLAFGLFGIARSLQALVGEQQKTNRLLEENNTLLKENNLLTAGE
jgi:hypothetical protein